MSNIVTSTAYPEQDLEGHAAPARGGAASDVNPPSSTEIASFVMNERPLSAVLESARRALAVAGSFDEVKTIRDRAEALRVYLRSITAAREAQNECAEIKIRAERRMGEELAWLEKNVGTKGQLAGEAPSGRAVLAVTSCHRQAKIKQHRNIRRRPSRISASASSSRRAGRRSRPSRPINSKRTSRRSRSRARS